MKVKINDLCFSYTQEKVLDCINIEFNAGINCIVGPNGSGKSTLLKCMNRILKIDSGQIFIGNNDIKNLSYIEIAKLVAYVPQSSNKTFSETVFDIVCQVGSSYIISIRKLIMKWFQVLHKLNLEKLL